MTPLFFLQMGVLALLISSCSTSQSVAGTFPLQIASLDGQTDTVEFHIGSPLVLAVENRSGRACSPNNGRYFVFGQNGTQLGWGFVEVADSVALPTDIVSCRRYLLLSAEASNRLPEGVFQLSVALLLDATDRIVSDTIVLKPVMAPKATAESYGQFLLEQIIVESTIVKNMGAIGELFAPHLPKSGRIDLYEGIIRYRLGDLSGAKEGLSRFRSREDKERTPQANEIADRLSKLILQQTGS